MKRRFLVFPIILGVLIFSFIFWRWGIHPRDKFVAPLLISEDISARQKLKHQMPYQVERVVFLANFDLQSALARTQFDKIDQLIYMSLHLKNAQADLVLDDVNEILSAIPTSEKNHIKIIPSLDNFLNGNTQSAMLDAVLADPDKQKKLIQLLLAYVRYHQFWGINIDLENISLNSKQNFILFIRKLTTVFHQDHRLVYLDLPAMDDSISYKKLAALVDDIVLMAYDEHWSTSKPGPIASIGWYKNVLKQCSSNIPAQKLIIGLGNYGYDWQEDQAVAQSLTFEDTLKLAKQYSTGIVMDPVALNPRFDYEDQQHKMHHVWFLDAITAFNQVALALPLQPHGFALWRLGSEDPSIWEMFGKKY